MGMSDADAFLGTYKDALKQEVETGGWPSEFSGIYAPESCLKHSGDKKVYLVIDRRTGGRAILRASDLDANERADVEYQILSRLDFPGVPKAYGIFVRDGRSYLSREYFSGEPLDQVIARGTMQTAQIYATARQLCAILEYLHTQVPPVIHRDIKPQNIIMRSDGTIGLTDFGIARTYKEGSSSDTSFAGTMPYAPPEQYGFAQSSAQTDIYALGIVLIYLATGSPNRQDLARRIPDASLRGLIEKCIALDPKDRFQNVGQVVKRIDSMKTRKLRLAAGILAAVFALILVGVGAYLGITTMLDSLRDIPSDLSVAGNDVVPDYPEGSDPLTYENPLIAKSTGAAMLYDYNNDGNLDGNLNNEGFAVGNGLWFFIIDQDVSNEYGGELDHLYRIDDEEAVPEKLYESSWIDSLNIYDHNVYFGCAEGLMRYDGYEEEMNLLTGGDVRRVFFDDGKLYYLQGESNNCTLRTIGTDGRGDRQVIDHAISYTDACFSFCDGVFYYTVPEEGSRLYAYDLSAGTETVFLNRRVEEFSICNGNIYFVYKGVNDTLLRMNIDSGTIVELSPYAYYQINASPKGLFAVNCVGLNSIMDPSITDEGKFRLEVMDGNGGNIHAIRTGYIGNYCLANDWIFYYSEQDGFALRMMRLDGMDDQLFDPEKALSAPASAPG
jgi:hypothetical protein